MWRVRGVMGELGCSRVEGICALNKVEIKRWSRADQCGAVWCSVVQCGAVWCSVVQCGVVWCGVM